jgi:hypothetical protein
MEDIFDTPFDSIKNPYESFYHGLVNSKIWLCSELEHAIHIKKMHNPALHILACWHNLLAFMLITRRSGFYGVIHGYDIDPEAIEVANKITNTWQHDYPKVYNQVLDINNTDFSSHGKESIFINCSVDQLDSTKWFETIAKDRMVCLQATDVQNADEPWLVKQTTKDINELKDRFQLSEILYEGVREVNYHTLKYNRFMLIGIK